MDFPLEILEQVVQHCSTNILKRLRLADVGRGKLHDAASSILFKRVDLRYRYKQKESRLPAFPGSLKTFVRQVGIELFHIPNIELDFAHELQVARAAQTFVNAKTISLYIEPEARWPGQDQLPSKPTLQMLQAVQPIFSKLKEIAENRILRLVLYVQDSLGLAILQALHEAGLSPAYMRVKYSLREMPEVIKGIYSVPLNRWAPKKFSVSEPRDTRFLCTVVDPDHVEELTLERQGWHKPTAWQSACLAKVRKLTYVYLCGRRPFPNEQVFLQLEELIVPDCKSSMLSSMVAPNLRFLELFEWSTLDMAKTATEVLSFDLPALRGMKFKVQEERRGRGNLPIHETVSALLARLAERRISLDLSLRLEEYQFDRIDDVRSLEALLRCISPVTSRLKMELISSRTFSHDEIKWNGHIKAPNLERLDMTTSGPVSADCVTLYLEDLVAPLLRHFSLVTRFHVQDFSATSKALHRIHNPEVSPNLKRSSGLLHVATEDADCEELVQMCASLNRISLEYGFEDKNLWRIMSVPQRHHA